MKIALLGYGKMGQVITIAIERGHEIILKKTRTTPTMALQMLM
jgi:pyrroline-5-carboxylate reductase